MSGSVAMVTLMVRDYDEAIAFFTRALRFELVEGSPREEHKRWVLVRPRGGAGAAVLLARATTPEQMAAIGRQAGGRVAFFLHTDDFAGDHAHMRGHGVRFVEEPRQEAYGTVAVFLDLHGNRWDLIEPRS